MIKIAEPIKLLLTITLLMLVRCALPDNVGGTATEDIIPVPTTESVMPLQKDNKWSFLYTQYDSTGTPTSFPNRDAFLTISGMYYLDSNSNLIDLQYYEPDSLLQGRNIIYRYEWNGLGEGYLVYHRGTGAVDKRGLYIIGTFVNTHTVLYESARLWFAYPVEENRSWPITLPEDDSTAWTMECVSKKYATWFGRANDEGPSPITFVDSCYLYCQSNGDHVYYHCFHPDYGLVSMRYYYKDVLQKSYLLISESLLTY